MRNQLVSFSDVCYSAVFLRRKIRSEKRSGGAFWDAGAEVFINKGVNGRWTDTLPKQECDAYEKRAVAELGADCAHWLKTGERRDRS